MQVKPDDIPADIWHGSCDHVNEWDFARDLMGMDYAAAVDGVARAVMAERERCAKIAEGPAEAWGEFPGATIERDRIAAAIRRHRREKE